LQFPTKKAREFYVMYIMMVLVNTFFAVDYFLHLAAFGFNWIRRYKKVIQMEILFMLMTISSVIIFTYTVIKFDTLTERKFDL
jgi:hypothetical protein